MLPVGPHDDVTAEIGAGALGRKVLEGVAVPDPPVVCQHAPRV